MFHKFFKRQFYNKLHSEAPYPKERLIYLDYWQKHGASSSCLRKITLILLAGANCLSAYSKDKVSIEEMNKSLEQLSCHSKKHEMRGIVLNTQYKTMYPGHMKRWLKMIGRLDDTIKIDYPFSEQLISFENYQRNERMLTEISIDTSSFILKIFLKYIAKKNIFSRTFVQKILMNFSFMRERQAILE